MRQLLVLLAAALLGAGGVTACGGAGNTASTVATVRATKAAPPGQAYRYVNFGHEASRAQAQVIRALVKRYFAAVAANDGQRACALLYSPIARSVPEDDGKSPPAPPEQRGTTCAAVMSLMFKYRRGQPTADVTAIEVTHVRIEGSEAIALLHSKTLALGEISAFHNKGGWQIGQFLGSALSSRPTSVAVRPTAG